MGQKKANMTQKNKSNKALYHWAMKLKNALEGK